MPTARPALAAPVAIEATVAAGLNYGRGTQGETAVFDLDGDGDYDLVPSRHGTAPWPIMRNNGDGTFTEISRGVLVKDDRHGCIAGDFGSLGGGGRPDGQPDLYCVEGACRGNKSCGKENDLIFQTPGGNFSTNQAKKRNVADIRGRGRQAAALDFDRDGLLDIAVANYGPSVYATPNRLLRNTGGGKFKVITGTPVNAEKTSQCVAAGDLDGDGWPELMFCAGKSGDKIRTLTYKNVKGKFKDTTSSSPYRKVRARSIKIIDLDQDGRQDLIIVEQKRLRIWLNGKKGLPSKPSYTRAIAEGRDVAVGDMNGDGKLDLYLCNGWKSGSSQAQDEMLVNNGNSHSFHTVAIPQTAVGDGDAVAAIPDWAGSGLAAFLVANGKSGSRHGPGPTQLITFQGS